MLAHLYVKRCHHQRQENYEKMPSTIWHFCNIAPSCHTIRFHIDSQRNAYDAHEHVCAFVSEYMDRCQQFAPSSSTVSPANVCVCIHVIRFALYLFLLFSHEGSFYSLSHFCAFYYFVAYLFVCFGSGFGFGFVLKVNVLNGICHMCLLLDSNKRHKSY